jgi:hypothetical protein
MENMVRMAVLSLVAGFIFGMVALYSFAAPCGLNAQELSSMGDFERNDYVETCGLPDPDNGYVWAEDFTQVPYSFYS